MRLMSALQTRKPIRLIMTLTGRWWWETFTRLMTPVALIRVEESGRRHKPQHSSLSFFVVDSIATERAAVSGTTSFSGALNRTARLGLYPLEILNLKLPSPKRTEGLSETPICRPTTFCNHSHCVRQPFLTIKAQTFLDNVTSSPTLVVCPLFPYYLTNGRTTGQSKLLL